MSPSLMVGLEFLIVFGPLFVWGAWEYWKLRPGKPESDPPQPASELPEDTRHPER
jgi:hypothetical protein